MNTFEKRLARLGLVGQPREDINPLMVLAMKLLLARPDAEHMYRRLKETNDQNRLPSDPLLRAVGRLIRASYDAVDAGLLDSDWGERQCQAAEREAARWDALATLTDAEATERMAMEREMWEHIVATVGAHWPALMDEAFAAYVASQLAKPSEGKDTDDGRD